MIISIAREKVSSVSYDNSSIVHSDSSSELPASSLTTSSNGSVIPNTARDTFGESVAESTTSSAVESESSREFDLAFLSYQQALRAQAQLRLETSNPPFDTIGYRE